MGMSANNVDKVDEIDKPMKLYTCMPLGSKVANADRKQDAQKYCHLDHTEDIIDL
jgi:hypothetical protein